MFLDHLVNVTKLTRSTSQYVKEAAEGHDYIVVIDSEPRAALISLADYRLLQEIKARTSAPGELSQLDASPNRLLAALGIADIDTWEPEVGWRATEYDADLVVPLGVALASSPQTGSTIVSVNLSTTLHGLMQGTTGAGKTNQLDEIVLALCANYSPTRVNIIRFNASGFSSHLNNPAHIVFDGGYTPLADDAVEPPINLLMAKLEHELSYRRQYLSDLGVDGFPAYLNLRRTGAHTGAPLAQLVVLIDSYSNLIAEAPQDLADRLTQLFTTLTQQGRTCGINVVLSDQLPRETHLRPLIVNIGYTVSMRTEANARLRLLPGSDASTQLPIEPGHGLISIRSDEPLIRFRGFGVHQPLPGTTDNLSDAIYSQLAPASRRWMTPSSPAQSAELSDVLGITEPTNPDITASPQHHRKQPNDGVIFPIGIDSAGETIDLDLTGNNTTGIVVSADGTALSEFIRGAVYSLALTHTPSQASVIYLDAHDNSIAKTIDRLPHVAAALINLARTSTAKEQRASERARLALLGELAHRHSLLEKAGSRDAAAYRQWLDHKTGTDNAMPTLWIVINGFQDISKADPRWAQLLTDIADRGRAVDMRITLIGRRSPETAAMTALKTTLGHRIALRTASAEDSRTVIGSDQAYFLPQDQRGQALLLDGGHLSSFKTLSMADTDANEADAIPNALSHAVAVAVDQPAHRAWPPSLEVPSPIDTLIESWRNKPWNQDYGDEGEGSHLWLPIGVVDKPFHLFQGVEAIDLATQNVLVTGNGGAGKTTTLLTLATAACLLYKPGRIHLLCIGDERMLGLEQFPHVAAFADSRNAAEAARLVRVAMTIRDRRAADSQTHDDAIVLVIDNFVQFADNSTILSALHALAQDNGRYGIHLIASHDADLRSLGDNTLRINLSDAAPLHWATSSAPDTDNSEVLIGVPRVGDTDDLADIGLWLQQATRFQHSWTVPRPTNIALSCLPLPEDHSTIDSAAPIPFAVDATMGETVSLDLSRRPHFLTVGRARAGKDNVLAAVAQSLMNIYTPEQLQIHVIDPASTLVGRITGPHVQAYCYEQQTITEHLAQLASVLKARLPQPGLSQEEVLEHYRAGWGGPRHIVIINDALTLKSADGYSDPPHMPVIRLLDTAKSIGLHVIAAQRVDAWDSISQLDSLILGVCRTGSPILFLDNDPATCRITASVRGQHFPPGRGILAADSAATEVLVAIAD